MAERDGQAAQLELRFVNFEPDQARGFIQSTEMRLPDGKRVPMSGKVEPREGLTPVVGKRMAKGEWDPKQARMSTERLADGIRHSIEIPAVGATRSPIRIIIDGTAEAMTRVNSAVQAFLAQIRTITDPGQLFAAIHDFAESLRSVPGIRRVDPVITEEAGDIVIVELRPPLVDDAAA
jgi:hypothetical protein